MEQSCPIVHERVDEKLVRLNASIVFIGLLFFVFTPAKWVIIPIAADFAIRVFLGVKRSPICLGIKFTLNVMQAESHLINAGPKRFAAKIGLVLMILIGVLYFFDFTLASKVVGIISLVAIGAEAFSGFCVACQIYNILPAMGIKIK